MILAGGTLCSESNEWIVPIHMWLFSSVGDVLLLFLVLQLLREHAGLVAS